MTRRISLVCTLTLMAMTLVASEAAAQRGRGRGWGSGGPGQGWGRGCGPGGYGRGLTAAAYQGRGCLFGPRMAYELGVTTAQQESIDKLYVEAADSAVPLLRELDRTESELSALIASAKAGDGAVEKLRKRAQVLDEKIEGIWSQYRQQVLTLLTLEQRHQYERLAVGYGPYGCRGYGSGYGRGMGRHLRWERDGYGRGRGRGW